MFKRIMVPIDLLHIKRQTRALECAADLARHYNADIVFVAVTSSAPSELAHTPAEFAEKLMAFAADQASQHGITATAHAITSHDPAVELDKALLDAVNTTQADLVVMASHDPGLIEYVWPSNGGKIAGHAHASVLVIR